MSEEPQHEEMEEEDDDEMDADFTPEMAEKLRGMITMGEQHLPLHCTAYMMAYPVIHSMHGNAHASSVMAETQSRRATCLTDCPAAWLCCLCGSACEQSLPSYARACHAALRFVCICL